MLEVELANMLAEAICEQLGLGMARISHATNYHYWTIIFIPYSCTNNIYYFIRMEIATTVKAYCVKSVSGAANYSKFLECDISDPACIDKIIELSNDIWWPGSPSKTMGLYQY